MQSAEEKRPPGLKPRLISETYAALKGHSSTAIRTFVTLSRKPQKAFPDTNPTGTHRLLWLREDFNQSPTSAGQKRRCRNLTVKFLRPTAGDVRMTNRAIALSR